MNNFNQEQINYYLTNIIKHYHLENIKNENQKIIFENELNELFSLIFTHPILISKMTFGHEMVAMAMNIQNNNSINMNMNKIEIEIDTQDSMKMKMSESEIIKNSLLELFCLNQMNEFHSKNVSCYDNDNIIDLNITRVLIGFSFLSLKNRNSNESIQVKELIKLQKMQNCQSIRSKTLVEYLCFVIQNYKKLRDFETGNELLKYGDTLHHILFIFIILLDSDVENCQFSLASSRPHTLAILLAILQNAENTFELGSSDSLIVILDWLCQQSTSISSLNPFTENLIKKIALTGNLDLIFHNLKAMKIFLVNEFSSVYLLDTISYHRESIGCKSLIKNYTLKLFTILAQDFYT